MKLVQLTLCVFWLAFSACEKQATPQSTLLANASSGNHTNLVSNAAALTTTVENFETGTKAAYAAANVTLSTGTWNFDDALLGALSTDRKNGTQSARVRNSGTLTNISETTTNVWTGGSANPILHGSQGNVSQLQFNNGATVTINPSANSTVQGLIWQSGQTQNTTHIMSASSTYGTGRVFVVTDSSPMDDGTGASGNTLFVSWPLFSHTQLFMNASYWLARLQ